MPIDDQIAGQISGRAQELERRHAAGEISTLEFARGVAALRGLAPGETASAVAAAAGLTPTGQPRVTAPDLSGCERIADTLTDDVLTAAGAAEGHGREVLNGLRMKALLTLARHGGPRLAETLARVIQQGGGGPAAVERAIEDEGAEPPLGWRADIREDGSLLLELQAGPPEHVPGDGAAALERWLAEHLDPWRARLREIHRLPAWAGAREKELQVVAEDVAARMVASLGGERLLRAFAEDLPNALRAARNEMEGRRGELKDAHGAVQEMRSVLERRLNALAGDVSRARAAGRSAAPTNLEPVLAAIRALGDEMKRTAEAQHNAGPRSMETAAALDAALAALAVTLDGVRADIAELKVRRSASGRKKSKKKKGGILRRLLRHARRKVDPPK